MTFRLDLANRAGLFQNYAAWHEDGNWNDKTHMDLAFRIGFSLNLIERIHLLKNECIGQYEVFSELLRISSPEFEFNSPSMFDLVSNIAVIINQIRMMQDKLIECIGKHANTSVPMGMNKFVHKIHEYKILPEIKNSIYEYWINNGSQIKRYRDLDQHFQSLVESTLMIRENSTVSLSLRLPDNPESNNSKFFTYQKKIDAIAFVSESFEYFHKLLNRISVLLGYSDARAFDYNIVSTNNAEILSIAFDENSNLLVANEIFCEAGRLHARRIPKACNLSQFSFVKSNQYFTQKHSFIRHIAIDPETGIEPSFLLHDRV